ncbi:MAG: heavy-metal-associated domain-containing protein [Clostridia bacterium]|nr:heavy-metal-associated domain-containing protein [Clostridia bacterium]
MIDILIIAVILAAAVVGICSTVRHFRNRGGCCGGGGFTPKKKKLKNIRYTRTFRVEGMHCAHCKGRVEEIVNDIKGIAGKVDLKNGELTVFYAEDVDDALLKTRIERAGYHIPDIP